MPAISGASRWLDASAPSGPSPARPAPVARAPEAIKATAVRRDGAPRVERFQVLMESPFSKEWSGRTAEVDVTHAIERFVGPGRPDGWGRGNSRGAARRAPGGADRPLVAGIALLRTIRKYVG